MLSVIAKAALEALERELIAKEPEIEPLILDQVMRLAKLLNDYVAAKLEGTQDGQDIHTKSN